MKYRSIRLIIGMIALSLVFFLLSGCSQKLEKEEKLPSFDGYGSIPIYYTNDTATTLTYRVLDLSEPGQIKKSIDEIFAAIASPEEDEASILPDKIRITYDYSVLEQNEETEGEPSYSVTLRVWGPYAQLSANVENVFRIGIMKSIINLSCVSTVSMYRGASSLPEDRISSLSADTIIVNEEDENFFRDTVSLKLYFVDEKGKKLTSETVVTTVSMSERVVDKVMALLLAGPQDPLHKSPIPQESAVNEIMVKNKVCYVDMNEAFVKNQLGGEKNETLAIYSIVNSLTRLADVSSVQILIDGQQQEFYKDYVKINIPLSFNEEITAES